MNRFGRSVCAGLARARPMLPALAGLLLAALLLPAGAAPHAGLADPAPRAAAATAAPYWDLGRKDGVGSAFGRASTVWYTLAGGQLTEVFYPTTDTPDIRTLSFVVAGPGFVDRQGDGMACRTAHPDPRSVQYVVTCAGRSHSYSLRITYFADPQRPTVLMHLRLAQPADSRLPLRLSLRYLPALNANATHDQGRVAGHALLAHDDAGHYGPVASALVASPALGEGVTVDEAAGGTFAAGQAAMAGPGTIMQTARLPLHADGTADLGLAFASSEAAALRAATASLARPFAAVLAEFVSGWHGYADGLRQPEKRFTAGQRAEYFIAALTLKASEDKRYPGAMVASLSTPWGQALPATGDSGQGYHRVWARDLYEMAGGLAAAGDTATAREMLTYMLSTLEEADGGMPQNSLVDGTPVDGAVQLDEVAYPLVLAWSLGLDSPALYRAHLRALADYLVRKGPATDQERWEEDPGYSPSTIAAEIAALVAAAAMADRNGDAGRALVYRAVADDWQRNVKSWTVTSTGPLARHPYFIRLDDNSNPNDGGSLAIAGGAPQDERAVVDAGFLELVRLGVLPPADQAVVASLPVIDAVIRAAAAFGPVWYRYNHDTYGDSVKGTPWGRSTQPGVGHPWPVLGGERGEYDLSLGHVAAATAALESLRRAASPTGMIPEQIWERASLPASPPGAPPQEGSIGMTTGQGDGSAQPLNWALGQYLRLLADLQSGRLLDRPAVVQTRYQAGPVHPARLIVVAPAADLIGNSVRAITVRGRAAPGARVTVLVSSALAVIAYPLAVAPNGAFSRIIPLPPAYLLRLNIGAQDAAGDTAFVLRRVSR